MAFRAWEDLGETGLEVFYIHPGSKETEGNYEIWTGLLARDKRGWAIAGGNPIWNTDRMEAAE